MAEPKKTEQSRAPKAPPPENPPVSPVENFDLDRVDKDRRMFGNGDTDREDVKE